MYVLFTPLSDFVQQEERYMLQHYTVAVQDKIRFLCLFIPVYTHMFGMLLWTTKKIEKMEIVF